MSDDAHCSHETDATGTIPGPGRNLVVTALVFVAVYAVSLAPPFDALNDSLNRYLALIWWAVALGLVIGGVIDYFVPDGFVVSLLGQRRPQTLLYAVLAGVVMSACSHGILALAIQLYKKGASVPAVITFLLASPWANLPMTLLLFGFFGWQALYFIGGAMLIALFTGIAYTVLDRYGLVDGPSEGASPESVSWDNVRNFESARAARGIAAGAMSLANMVLWWILIGIMAAALIGAYVPEHWFLQFLGPDLSGIVVTLLFATVLEVCSEGTSPIAFEIFDVTGVLGNPFVFLVAGVATDYTEIGLLWTAIGRRTAIWLPVVTVPQILIAGLLLNML